MLNNFKDWFAMNEGKKKNKGKIFNLKPIDDTLFNAKVPAKDPAKDTLFLRQSIRTHIPHKSGAGSHDSREKPRKKTGWDKEYEK